MAAITAHPCTDQRIGAGRRAALMRARFECDVERGSARLRASFFERDHFGVLGLRVGVKSAPDDLAVLHQYGADGRIRAGAAQALAGQFQRFVHEWASHHFIIGLGLSEEGRDEFVGFERQQVGRFFADADVADGQVQFAGDGNYDAALRRSVQFG